MNETVRTGEGGGLLLRAREALVQAAKTLAGATQEIGDTFSAAGLRLLIPRLEQGLVRVAVIGVTSSGKSALINALLKNLIVPENPNVSSPIPVWIGYEPGKPKVTIYRTGADSGQVEREECSIPDFQTRYCYNAEHFKKRDEDHFSAVRYGSVSVESECLHEGMVLVDTLGIAASDIDTAKTHSVLEEGVDLVLFVSKSVSFSRMEVEFLQNYILGVNPDKRQVTHPVAPRNILFAVNPFGLDPVPVKAAVRESVREVFSLSGLGQAELDALFENNVFYVHALKGRYGECGVYPYVERAPAGSTEKDKKALRRKQDEEQTLLDDYSRDQLLADSGVIPLRKGLAAHVRRQSYGADAAVVRRIRELSNQAANVQLAASNRLKDMKSVETSLEKTKETCTALETLIGTEKGRISTAMTIHRTKYITALAKVYRESYDQMRNECVGMATNADMPPDFDQGWGTFRRLDTQRQQEYISGFLPPLTKKIREYCIELILKTMELNKAGDELEASRRAVQSAGITLGALIEKLEESGARTIGAALPTQESIDALYGQLKSSLMEGVSDAIKHSIADAVARFHQKMDAYVKQVKWGPLLNWLPHGRRAFWGKVCNEVLKPLAELLVEEVLSIADSTEKASSALAQEVSKCYSGVENDLRDNFTNLLYGVKTRVYELEEMIRDQRKVTGEELERYRRLQSSCQELSQQLNEWVDVFLNEPGV